MVMAPKSFQVENFKSIKDSGKVDVEDLNIFIGKNDTGKSSFLEAIKIFLALDKPTKDHFHKWEADKIIIKAFFDDPPTELTENFGEDFELEEGEKLIIKRKFNRRKGTTPKDDTFINGEKLSKGAIVKDEEELRKAKSRDFIWDFMPEPISIVAERKVSEETKMKKGTFLNKLILPILQGDVGYTDEPLEDVTKKLENRLSKNAGELAEKLSKKIQSHMPDLEGVDIEPGSVNLGKAIKPKISLEDKYLKNSVDVSERGSGVGSLLILSLMQTYADRDIGSGYCLLFEEPGNCLHPGAERQMLNALKKISEEGGQIFITTHSQVFIDEKDSGPLYLVKRKEGESNFRKIGDDSFKAIEEIGAKNSDLLQSDFVIYVEGPSDVEMVNTIARNTIDDWDERNVVVQHLGGTGNLDHCEPEKLRKINRNFCFLLDSDRESESDETDNVVKTLREECEEIGIECKILEKREIENYFSIEAINEVFNLDLESDFITDFKKIPDKLADKIAKEYSPHYDEMSDEKIRSHYSKIKHGKEIVKKMYENGTNIPEVENFLQTQFS